MKHKYYMFRSAGYVADYFGEIGEPYEVSMVVYLIAKLFKYRTVRVLKNVTVEDVKVQAAINSGAHPNSYFVMKQRKTQEHKSKLNSVWR